MYDFFFSFQSRRWCVGDWLFLPPNLSTFIVVKKQLILKKNEERRLIAGHQWIFSNEISRIVGSPSTGDIAELLRNDGKFLGVGFYHQHSLICFRLLSREQEEIDGSFFERKISQALQLRASMSIDSNAYRLIHGEGDFLPGLIVDRYGDSLVLQTHSSGMDQRLPVICDALESLLKPRVIVERNEHSLRTLEGLPLRAGILRGNVEEALVLENGISFRVSLQEGQKTGLFLDQRENRARIRRYVKGKSVLDCFTNNGGFALNAAAGGARSVLGMDSSAEAVRRAQHNATQNAFSQLAFVEADVFKWLESTANEKTKYDVVILDPPAFAKSKKTVSTALKGYREINTNAMKIISSGGFLATASCSHHVSLDAFLGTIQQSAERAERRVQLLETHSAGADHPSIPSMPETTYLKFCILAIE
jgi:23S rRNA (cytosine1962-C5)-methyltransferase